MFFEWINDFVFLKLVWSKIWEFYLEYKKFLKGLWLYIFVKMMFNEDGFNFVNFFKGLILFYKYKKYIIMVFEE